MPDQLQPPMLLLVLTLLALMASQTGAVLTSAPGQMSLCSGSSRYQCAQSCYEGGMRLVTIKDLDTNNRVKAFLLGKKVDKAYVGMDDQAREGYFQRSDGTVYVKDDFNRWASASGGPEQPNEGDDCVTVDSDGNWRVESCTLQLPSVCEGALNLIAPAARWTAYCNSDRDPSDGDNENINFARVVCGDLCNNPFDWKCRVAGTALSAASTGQNFSTPCSREGIVCDKSQNAAGCNDYEVAYLCPADIDECALKLHKCDPNADCLNTPGSYVCQCKAGYSGDGFNCRSGSTCSAFGSAHVVTFDGAHQFGGSRCDFQLAANCNATAGAKYAFSVESRQDAVGGAKVFVVGLLVKVYDLSILVHSENGVSVNGMPITPSSQTYSGSLAGQANSSVSIVYMWNDVVITTDYGLRVSYDMRRYLATIFVPQLLGIKPCGLCGDADGHQANDLTPKGASTVSADPAVVYASWMTPSQTNSNCKKEEVARQAETSSIPSTSVMVICNALVANYAFSTYLSDATLRSVFNDACHSDMSAPVDNVQLCQLASVFYRVLSARGLLSSAQLFPPGLCQENSTCRANEQFAEAARPCEPNDCATIRQGAGSGSFCGVQRRLPACQCRPGYRRSGNTCVRANECGCSTQDGVGGAYKARGQVWYSQACAKKNTCNGADSVAAIGNACRNNTKCVELPDGAAFCDCAQGFAGPDCEDIDECAKGSHACHTNAVCVNTAGAYQCRCQSGYQGNGFNCTDVDECAAAPSPCSANAICRNLPGSYQCACVSPYVGDGKTCGVPFIAPNYANASAGESGCSYLKELQCDPASVCSDLVNGSIFCACPHGSLGDGYKGAGHSGCGWPNCPSNYTSIEGFCYYYDATKRNHSAAAEYCATLGGTLVTILDDRVASQVKVLLNAKLVIGNFWTGYADDKTSDCFPPMDFVGSLWQRLWIAAGSNSSVSSGVGSFRPDMCGSAVLNAGAVRLEARPCSQQLGAVCKVPGSTRSCPEGWQSLGGSCYFMSDSSVTYEDAMLQCALLGADLVSIGANDVSKFLYDYFFNSRSGSGYHWIGLQYDTLLARSAFAWWDGSPYNPSYLMWDSSEPAAGKNCAAISTQARWATRACGDKLGYICQKQRWAYYRCPRNAYYFNGKCYTVIATTQNFTSHLQDCRSLGGDLIAFQTPEEYTFFSRIIYTGQTGPKSFYTGLFLAANATNFTNSDGSRIVFYNWKDGVAPANASAGRCTQIADPAEGYRVTDCSTAAWAVCEFENTPCLKHSDCAANGECFLGQCRCKKGFYGDGKRSCVDVDECKIDGICQAHSTCYNLIGSYRCDCDTDYQLNAEGRCQHIRYCVSNSDCLRLAACIGNMCTCNRGYQGDGVRTCVDIDECLLGTHDCSPNATCANNPGSFTCACKNGFAGDGKTCAELPRTCHELRLKKPAESFPRRSKQTIDPDGTGPLDALEVTCEMYADYGVTVFPPEANEKIRYSGSAWRETIIYTSIVDEMISVVGNSAFCIQVIRYNCFYGANPMEDMLYYDRNMKTRQDWGSGTEGKCLCGTVGLCRQKAANCNCNGDASRGSASDFGYVINRDLLPLRGFRGRASRGAGEHVVGELRCSGVQFDIPATCDDHPDRSSSNVHLIDPDQRGELPPFPVMCFNPFCRNSLIGSTTVVSHDNFGQRCSYGLSKSVSKGDNPLTYCAPVAQLQLLKSMMSFCSQEIRYDCNNSPLVSAGNEASRFYTAGKRAVPNMGFGSPGDKTCPCSALDKCTNKKSCNCDNTASGWTYDFGWVLNKDHLPIMGINAENIGPSSFGNVSVGYFACSSRQFGIMGSCQMYRTRFREDDDATFILRSYSDNYVYPIDPDLKGAAIQPFPAYCSMGEFDTGVTIIPNLAAGSSACSNTSALCETKARYYHTKEQIASIASRSTYCSQAIVYRCRQSPLLLGAGESTRHAYWKSLRTGASRYDFGRGFQTAPDGGVGCGCSARGGAAACGSAGLKCACDASGDVSTSEDILLDDKDALPADSMFVSGKTNYVEFGDMMCYDISESCVARYRTGFNVDIEEMCIYQRLGDLYLLPNQYKGGFNPIPGRCNPGGETEIQIVGGCVRTTQKDVDPVSRERCYNIQYYSAGVPINNEQVSFLAKQSAYCIQYARYLSKLTPFTGNVRWTSLSGGQFTQWAGTQGRPGCACGIAGVCQREGDACNTDRASSDWSEDRGWFVNFRGTGDLIPMTQLCTKLGTNETAETQICLDSVRCMDTTDLRIPKDCQDIRDGNYLYAPASLQPRTVEPWIINPYGGSDKPPALATCDQTNSPPIGVTIVGHKTCGSFGKAGGLFNVSYAGFPRHQLDALIQSSTYCTQRVEFKCRSAAFSVTSSQGANDRDGVHLAYWGDNAGGSGCKGGGACKCDGSPDWKDDDAIFTDKSVLPISSVRLDAVAAADSERKICVHELRCYKVYPDCHSFYSARGTPPYPNGRGELAVDPDQAGPLEPFSVACDIAKCPDRQNQQVYMGISRFYFKDFYGAQSYAVDASSGAATSVAFDYVSPSAQQAAALADRAGQCWQLVHAYSQRSGLLGAGVRISDRSGARVTYFSGSDVAMTTGCACRVLNTCANDSLCHADESVASQAARVLEGTYVINKSVLPITSVSLPAVPAGATLQVYAETMRCAPNYCGLPKHCSEVSQLGRRTSFEQWIQPGSEPFLVLCVPGQWDWATRVIVDKVTRNATGYTTVTYKTATPKQLTELVQSLTTCTQAVKVTCRNYRIMSNPGFALVSATGQRSRKFVSGEPQCACGDRVSCQGNTRAQIDSRVCNCDIADNVTRFDSGLLMQDGSDGSGSVPIVGIDTAGADASGQADWVLSDLFCGKRRVNLDECALGLHDCDPHADCAEAEAASITCTCQPGWRGLGVPGAIANGRQCFDDDECALGRCGAHTACVNLPGSFRCDCQPGYRHASPTECVDIDECAAGTHNCDSNARCINTDGSFICVCLPNYEGSGRSGDCREVGTCLCWGEPHCRSFDERMHHFQGACSYTLARDGCANGKPARPASFEVIQKNWRKDRPTSVVTWTKEIMVRVLGKSVILRQGMRVVLDGQLVNLPAEPLDSAGRPIGLSIRFFEGNVLLTTRFGLYVKWNGDDRIEVKVEVPFKRQMCGLCGDFDNNANNDWVLGPVCPPSGNATDNARLFGDSWRTESGGMDGDECQPGCSETPDPVCVGDASERAKTSCARLRDIFSSCAAAMTAVKDSFDTYIESCVYDTCLGGVDICQTATTIAAVCQSRYNSSAQWRRADFCPKTCGENQHYETCAAPCQATCVQPNMTALMATSDCAGRCTEACVCNSGYVMTSGRCVLPSRCGCQVDGLYYNIGDMLIKPNCTERCNCTVPGSTSLTCTAYKCHKYGFCGFEKDMYDCHCSKGFHGDGVVCDDDDECAIGAATNTGPCSPQATCTNTVGSYNCTCKSGWRGDGKVCDDIDECVENKPCNATTEECFNSPGSYECRCQDGFMRNPTTKLCDDKDECKLNQHSCHRASTDCRNTYGRYECDCKSGYSRVDQYKCKDINECANATLNTCHKAYATCTNTPGSYKCTCHQGFTGNGTVCDDVDECKNPNACYINATCTNTIGSFYCTCDDGNPGCTGPDPCLKVKCNGTQVYCYRGVCYCERGFVKNVTTGLCEDENECLTGSNNCTRMNALCLNTFGSYDCQCLVGYTYNPVTKVCEDIDECLENRHDCNGNAKCVNTDGGYQCQCQDGYMGHCEECRDIDECEFNLHLCDKKYATCNNTIGSYICACNPGFIGNGRVCVDINECACGASNCPALAACINTPGSFECQCSAGYVMSRGKDSCEDENECLSSKNDCSQFAKCINNVGSYSCQCLPGYSGDGVKCTKDNTKLDCNGVRCHPQATCDNATCVCLGGFEGNGASCTDIDECSRFPGICDKQATCYNTPGSYACQCKEGLSGDGKICYNDTNLITPCMKPNVCVNGICTDLPQGRHKCECRPGYQVRSDACVDIDECEQSDVCSSVSNSECKNTPGSYLCACSFGYEEQVKAGKRVCVSIEQCSRNSYLCGQNAQCEDVDGGYQCVCKKGFAVVSGSQPTTCAKGGGGKKCDDVQCPEGAYCKSNGDCQCLEPTFTASVGPGGTLRCVQVQDACTGVTCPANSTCQGANGGASCVCKAGLHFNPGGVCADVRECDNPLLNDCDLEHGRCVELVGSYRCECAEGYRLDATSKKCLSTETACNCGPFGLCLRNNSCWCRSGYTNVGGRCVDVDECSGLRQPCHRLADCTNTPGSYKCECPANYDGDGYNFCDLNECKLGSAGCASNALCINTLGSYRCECPSGYIGDGKTCVKGDNPCLFNNGGCGSVALCTWADQQITCQCPGGYRGNGLQCYDINECMEGTHNCNKDHAICTNNPGSFFCLCKQGYMGDGVSCRDIDECATGKSNCHQNAKCSNTDGSFTCACKPGFSGDGVATCNDVGDCRAKSLCDANARCVYTPQGYTCACNPGYQGNGFDLCRDIDECAAGTHQCVQHADCKNTPGSYACQCGAGFVGDGRTFCNDINECLDPRSCAGQTLTVCVNLPGGFSCPCAPGAQLKSGRCEDINECDSPALNKCHPTATCTNTQGSYTCACTKGYIGDGVDCQDVDECLSGTANCDKNALCVNTPGSFNCRCSAGLLGNGTTCDDVDECDKNKPRNQCHELATCVNQNPGYSCVCPPGYAGSGFFCAKRNPCSTPGLCSVNATCVFDGTYTRCVCKSGYVGNGRVCVADNSCAAGTHTCDLGTSVCVPRAPVGFDCECKPGFHKEGNLCVDNDECDPASPYYQPGVCGDPLMAKCANSPGGFNCLCTALAIKSGVSCIPLDVCQQGGTAAGCDPNAICEYLRPGHRCVCKPGYRGDGKTCTDIDECADGTHDCYDGATCRNIPGGYRCDCPKGLVQAKDPRACVDYDECTNDPYICGNYSRCINTRAAYTCECVLGWAWNPATKRCEDVDECKTGTHPCHSLAECTNTPGSCTCHCRPGYNGDGVYFCELNQNCPPPKSALCPAGSICRDQGNSSYDCRCPSDQLDKGVDSCSTGVCVHFCQKVDPCWTKAPRCSPYAKCQTINDEARCVCLDGFTGNGIVCDDVNECAGPNDCNATISSCRNLDNRVHRLNYTCDCVSGYETVLGTHSCVNINECDRGAACPANSRCVDTPGSYRCECNAGYRAAGPRGCIDIDECAENADDCNRGTADCVNLDGSFACRCKLGLEMLNRTHCQDINECATKGVCGPEQTCHNIFASYACSCPVGYTVNGIYCVDIDECSRNGSCHSTALCNNTRGSYQCYCVKGQRMALTGACEHINECSERADACPAGALCVDNTTTGYACACPEGYMNPPDNARVCQDIDECSLGMHNCTGLGSMCVNTMGGFNCKCQTGFAQKGADCVDVDECKLAADASLGFCQPGGSCVNTPGSFVCNCPDGYEFRDTACANIDECTLPSASRLAARCPPNQVCIDTVGSYRCYCPKGFTLDASNNCVDIDECKSANACPNGICTNTAGNYTCTCSAGYRPDGPFICVDIDECAKPDACGDPDYGVCDNKPGTFKCSCKPGSAMVDGLCRRIDECVLANVTCQPNSHCVSTTSGHRCDCNPGFLMNDLGQCVNEDECGRGTSKCDPMAECSDTIGSYTCTCRRGYQGDGRTCTSVCKDACASNQMCRVTEQNTPECTCDCVGKRCLIEGQVCDNKGRTHASEKAMFEYACRAQEDDVTVSYFAPCKKKCSDISCPESHICVTDPELNKPLCKCRPCTDADRNSGPVCTTDLVQFSNRCDYIKYKCYWKDSVSLSNMTVCRQPINCKVSEWSQWGGCSRTCGLGFQVRTRSLLRESQFNGTCPFEMTSFADCYAGPCPDGPCRSKICPTSHICVEVNSTAVCRCPNCDGRGDSAVCGVVGNKTDTYSNLCQLEREACEKNASYIVYHQEACGQVPPKVPAQCSLVYNFKRFKFPDGCESEDLLPLHKCDGGCGNSTDKCCVPLHVRTMTARYRCPDNSMVIRAIDVNVSCDCQKKSHYVTG